MRWVDFRSRTVAFRGHGGLPPKHRTCKCKIFRWDEHLAQSQVLRQDVAYLTCLAEKPPLRGFQTRGTALSFVPAKTICCSRRSQWSSAPNNRHECNLFDFTKQ